ncbi:G-protein coupled receptor family C group 5 member B [Galemys pyrenaicus]|uniref:G-protein coupled receptor family C group 5 member B n=1 Tax=Galemys pyrenaicus TaxID=202257 RepID=A0A8J6A7H6_GALPY|nr:G-protein coupled receptor family C group 5 member B [Galemys pyrenaicus]
MCAFEGGILRTGSHVHGARVTKTRCRLRVRAGAVAREDRVPRGEPLRSPPRAGQVEARVRAERVLGVGDLVAHAAACPVAPGLGGERGPGQGAPRAAATPEGDAVRPDRRAGVRGRGPRQRCRDVTRDEGQRERRRCGTAGAERKMRAHQVLAFLLLSVIASGASENASTSRGCGLDLLPQYVSLCDLDTIWGIVVEAVAGAGALITLLLMLILLVRLPFIKDKEKKDPVGLHFLFLLGTLGLFGLTFAFIIREDETICSVRRFLWGVLFALCFSCLLSQAWRVRRLVRHGKSPSGWQLVGVALCLMLVQVIIAIEWLVLTVLRDAKPACSYEPMDFVMALIYDMVLLVATLGLALFTLCGKFKKWKQNGACVLVTAFLSMLIWVAWMTMYLFGNAKLRQGEAWGDPTLAITLVASGWVFVIFHAIPEIHCAILPAPQENTPNYFDTSQPRMRETAFEEDVQLPRTYMENKAFSMDEHNAALRTAGFRNGSLGNRPSAPFRSNVYQPTEMAVVLNGGTQTILLLFGISNILAIKAMSSSALFGQHNR